MANTNLTFHVLGTDETLTVSSFDLVIAGYTGRDSAAVQHHIDELAAQGIAPPERVPMFYPVAADTATQQENCIVPSSQTAGEAEPVLIRAASRLFLAVGSDHTDRELERESVARSKQACVKPLSRSVIPVDADSDWDAMRLRSWVDGVLYQDGPMSALRVPVETLAQWESEVGGGGGSGSGSGSIIMFGGTVPLLHGTFVFGRDWTVQLALPDGTTLDHRYRVDPAPSRGEA
jgi:hypothetical protein